MRAAALAALAATAATLGTAAPGADAAGRRADDRLAPAAGRIGPRVRVATAGAPVVVRFRGRDRAGGTGIRRWELHLRSPGSKRYRRVLVRRSGRFVLRLARPGLYALTGLPVDRAGNRRHRPARGDVVLRVRRARGAAPPTAPGRPTAGGRPVDMPGLVSRSDIVLERAPLQRYESMPLGNGTLGAAVWAADGFTAQLNRGDTWPDLKSPGQLVVPGLAQLTGAGDYSGRVELHTARLVQRGGGMTATAYVDAERDRLVLDVRGADPERQQTAELRLWDPRQPDAAASGAVGRLAETFTDELAPPGAPRRFGALGAVTAVGRDVAAERVGARTVRVSFRPRPDGSFRILAGAPAYDGGDAEAAAERALADPDAAAAGHLAWWRRFWDGVEPFRMSGGDGAAEYLEHLRLVGLYTTAASNRARLPTSHGGVANLFAFIGDDHDWYPAGFWHWNLRMMVLANFGAGTEELNAPYFRLYLDNIANATRWTREHVQGSDGACFAETIRYEGTGTYPDSSECDTATEEKWTARIFSTGPEVALNAWRQFRFTGDQRFLDAAYPLMAASARFYLSQLKPGADGLLHLDRANGHETYWDTRDPATDLSAMRRLFPLVAGLADERDPDLARRLRETLPKVPQLRVLGTGEASIIAPSARDDIVPRNVHNINTEAIWPYELFGDSASDGDALARRTFERRLFRDTNGWSMDSVHAARLGLRDEVASLLTRGTQEFQVFPSGFSFFQNGGQPQGTGPFNGPYQEWNGVIASALHEALVQRYDGLLRIAPAWPAAWDVDGSVRVEGGHRVGVRMRGGRARYATIEGGSDETLRVRNPWPGETARAVDGAGDVVAGSAGTELRVPVRRGETVIFTRASAPAGAEAREAIGGERRTTARRYGPRAIGLPAGPPGPPRPSANARRTG